METISAYTKRHTFYAPKKILFGLNAIEELPEACKGFGNKVLVVTDSFMSKTEMMTSLLKRLKEAKLSVALYDGVIPEPPIESIEKGISLAREEGFDVIVGIGGGSSLDAAKGISIVAANGGWILDYVGIDQVPGPGLPKILIPTTSGTGSEVTRVFVVTDVADNTKKVVYSDYNLADIALIDPLLTLGLPSNVTAATGMDALVHAIETFVAVSATHYSEILAEKAIQLIAKYLPIATVKGSQVEARYYMSLAANISGLAFASGGLGAVHALAYPLGTEYHMPHGQSNAIMLPHVMAYNLPGNYERYAQIARLMGEKIDRLSFQDAALKAVEAVHKLLKDVGISSRLRDYGIKKEDLPKLIEGGLKQARLFVPNPRDLTREDVTAIYEMAY